MNSHVKTYTLALAVPNNVQVTELVLFSECLDMANRLLEARVFDYEIVGLNDKSQCSANETPMTISQQENPDKVFDTIVVFGTNQTSDESDSEELNWLRRQARHGALVGSIANGIHTLASSGLLHGKRVSLPRHAVVIFQEKYPNIEIVQDIYVIDDRCFTCCGGVATIDLAIRIISDLQGHELADYIADGFVYDIRAQRARRKEISTELRLSHADQTMYTALTLMKENIETPLSIRIIAQRLGISARHLQRKFARLLSTTPRQYYMRLRLARARSLLLETGLSVTEVSFATGFESPAHFSKNYRSVYKKKPSDERAKIWAIEATANINLEFLGRSMAFSR